MISDNSMETASFHSSDAEAENETMLGAGAVATTTAPEEGSATSAAVRAGHLSFTIPQADMPTFARLPDAARHDCNTTLILLRRIHQARSKSAECRLIASERAGQRGFSAQSLERKYYAYLDSHGDWKTVLDKAKCGPDFWNTDAPVGLPPAFVEFWKTLCERNQRKTAPARRKLVKAWETGYLEDATGKRKPLTKFPGYPAWTFPSSFSSLPSVNEIPVGWSQANLNRHAPKKAELAAARSGREAAAQFLPKVFKTRHGVSVGQFYAFDDQHYDIDVNFPGSASAQRPVGLNCLDIASACCVAWGAKPVLVADDGTRKRGLQQYMPFLIAHILCNVGYIPEPGGTTLIMEAGTATVNADIAQRIEAVTQRCVVVRKGNTSNTPSFPGLFEGASKGNPRFKAWLESFFNLVRNEMAALPGQTGLSYDRQPAQHSGEMRYNERLLKAAQSLPPERAALLRLPLMDFHQWLLLAAEIYRDINNRTEHDLEGWHKCGHVAQEMTVRLAGQVMKLSQEDWLALPREQRDALAKIAETKSRFLSPQEVFNRSATRLQRLSYDCLPALLGPDHGTKRTVQKGYLSFKDQEIDTDPFYFPCPHRDGQTLLCYQIPFAPDTLVLADLQGRFVETIARQLVPSIADTAGVAASIKYQAAREAELLSGPARRATPLAQAKRDMHAHNRAVLGQQPVTNEELQKAADLRARIKNVSAETTEALFAPASPNTLPPAIDPANGDDNDTLINNVL